LSALFLSPLPESVGLPGRLILLLNILDVHIDVKTFGAFGGLSSVFENNKNYPECRP
jgi:hypothetical protein